MPSRRKKLKSHLSTIFPFLFLFLFSIHSHGSIPTGFTYQGSLKESGSNVNGSYSMEFRITNSDGTQVYWTSGSQSITVTEGLYRVELNPNNVDWDSVDSYMEVKVNGTLLLPREKLNGTPYALITKDLASGATAHGSVHVEGPITLKNGNYELEIDFNSNTPSLQSDEVGVGNHHLSLNPNGGNVGVGTNTPVSLLHVAGPQVAGTYREQITYTAESATPGSLYRMDLGFRNNVPSFQGTYGSSYHHLALNPDGAFVGLGTDSPISKLHLVDNGTAGNQEQIIYSAESNPAGTPFQLRMGFRSNTASLQGYRSGVGNTNLLLNPDGAKVGIGLTNPVTKLHIYDDSTNTNMDEFIYTKNSGNPSNPLHMMFGFRGTKASFQAWHNNVGAETILLNPDGGNVAIGQSSASEKLEVSGNIQLSGALKDETGKPAFVVNVIDDLCAANSNEGCPSGYGLAGKWLVGGTSCDSTTSGEGYDNGTIDHGWMGLCVAQ